MTNPFEVFTLDQLQQRSSVKWREYPDCLPLWVAEMDVDIAEPVKRAVTRAMELGDTGYPFGDDYAQAFAGFAKRRWGWPVNPELVASCIDVMTGIAHLIRILSEPDAPVIITPPVYGPFRGVTTHLGRELVTAPLGGDGRLDLEEIRTALEATRGRKPVVLLSNPHNPTGVAHTAVELTAVMQMANAADALVIADEIHAPLILGSATFTPILSVPGGERAFSVFSASKAFNLAGLKAAIIIGGAETTDSLARLKQEAAESTSHLGVIAHAAALNEGEAWLDTALSALTANRDLLGELVAQHLPGARLIVPEATYLAWIDARDLGLPTDPALFFRENAHVAFSDGPFFGAREGTGHFRVNFATSRAILTEACERAGAALSANRG